MSERKIPRPLKSVAAGADPSPATDLGNIRRDGEQGNGRPPSPPIDSKNRKGDDNPMEERIEKLEDSAADAKERLVRIETRVDGMDERLATTVATKADMAEVKERLVRIETRVDGIDERLATTVATKADLAEAKERLVRIETRVDGIDEQLATTVATKADLAEAKFTVIMASISTMVALAGIVFAIARYFPVS